jgi:hypothetical protein
MLDVNPLRAAQGVMHCLIAHARRVRVGAGVIDTLAASGRRSLQGKARGIRRNLFGRQDGDSMSNRWSRARLMCLGANAQYLSFAFDGFSQVQSLLSERQACHEDSWGRDP